MHQDAPICYRVWLYQASQYTTIYLTVIFKENFPVSQAILYFTMHLFSSCSLPVFSTYSLTRTERNSKTQYGKYGSIFLKTNGPLYRYHFLRYFLFQFVFVFCFIFWKFKLCLYFWFSEWNLFRISQTLCQEDFQSFELTSSVCFEFFFRQTQANSNKMYR